MHWIWSVLHYDYGWYNHNCWLYIIDLRLLIELILTSVVFRLLYAEPFTSVFRGFGTGNLCLGRCRDRALQVQKKVYFTKKVHNTCLCARSDSCLLHASQTQKCVHKSLLSFVPLQRKQKLTQKSQWTYFFFGIFVPVVHEANGQPARIRCHGPLYLSPSCTCFCLVFFG